MMDRYVISIQGIVQGVGFRPFVHALAQRWELGGFVQNHSGKVHIEVEGNPDALNLFLSELTNRPPPLARIEHLTWDVCRPRGETEFRIAASENATSTPIFLSPDTACCDECLKELLDPADRRYRYPFINCTNCGPRLTIIQGAPYDRPKTTMASFRMCNRCRQEYEDPTDRRFHAQPIACWECGPQLELIANTGERLPSDDPLKAFAEQLRQGRIGALKGLGGYHLACDAGNSDAVRELRKRKHRDEKPFAVMVRDMAAAESLCHLDRDERELLLSRRRPIVLLRKHLPSSVQGEVAPGNPFLGIMLPYTPLHHLLMNEVGEALVMTSGNRSDEPIAHEDADALGRLADIADLFLIHNRPIHVRCDDSVSRIVAGVEMPVRRSRGYAPEPIPLPFACAVPILAVGGQLKATFALGRDRHAFVSHHMGDLDHFQAFRAFERDIELYEELFEIAPRLLAHDLHADYQSTLYAHDRAAREQIELLGIQHHHAHMAGCMAEHAIDERVIGVSFDGTGYGLDGAIWGGEFLVGDYLGFQRAGHLRYVAMPGGDQAIREPWRMAYAHLRDAEADVSVLDKRVAKVSLRATEQMIRRRFNTLMTSSAGRLFDAVASLIGLRDRVSHEGQAAIELEWLAMQGDAEGSYPFNVSEDAPHVVDTRPLIRGVIEDVEAGVEARTIARRFHTTVADTIVAVCERIRQDANLDRVVLSGGVFLNVMLTREVMARLGAKGFGVHRHQFVPPGDGGLSLGQLAIAARTLQARGERHQANQGAINVSRHTG